MAVVTCAKCRMKLTVPEVVPPGGLACPGCRTPIAPPEAFDFEPAPVSRPRPAPTFSVGWLKLFTATAAGTFLAGLLLLLLLRTYFLMLLADAFRKH